MHDEIASWKMIEKRMITVERRFLKTNVVSDVFALAPQWSMYKG